MPQQRRRVVGAVQDLVCEISAVRDEYAPPAPGQGRASSSALGETLPVSKIVVPRAESLYTEPTRTWTSDAPPLPSGHRGAPQTSPSAGPSPYLSLLVAAGPTSSATHSNLCASDLTQLSAATDFHPGTRIYVPARYVTLLGSKDGMWQVQTDDGRRCLLDPEFIGASLDSGAAPQSSPADNAASFSTSPVGDGAIQAGPSSGRQPGSPRREITSPTREGMSPVSLGPPGPNVVAPLFAAAQRDTLEFSGMEMCVTMGREDSASTDGSGGGARQPPQAPGNRKHPSITIGLVSPQTSPAKSPPSVPFLQPPGAELPPALSPTGSSSHSRGRRKVTRPKRGSPRSAGKAARGMPEHFRSSPVEGTPEGFTVGEMLDSPQTFGYAVGSLRGLPCALSDGVGSSGPPSPARLLASLLAPALPDIDEDSMSTSGIGGDRWVRDVTGMATGGFPRQLYTPRRADGVEDPLVCCFGGHTMTAINRSDLESMGQVFCHTCKNTSRVRVGALRCIPCKVIQCASCARQRVPVGVRIVHRAFDLDDKGVWDHQAAMLCQQHTEGGGELTRADWLSWCGWVNATEDPGLLPNHLAMAYRKGRENDLVKDVRAALARRPELSDMLPAFIARALVPGRTRRGSSATGGAASHGARSPTT
eukprot:TRINITY_DN2038_c0_g1_i1.p1 TRINITY_DN2038_c0_g1~~TRINITY_DN2038_c0_g1_i1.p1  ORF type:complete len:647 (+),score=107.03 TRINITY_DN2038_c0_g1_i1:145-2085(+)